MDNNVGDELNYELLAAWVRRRRRELDLTQDDIKAQGGPSAATVRQIEAASPIAYRRGTTEPLERILRWRPGTVRAILRGADPLELDVPPYDSSTDFVGEDGHDAGVLLSLPPDTLDGLTPAEREEVIAAAKLRALERAREIRRRLDS